MTGTGTRRFPIRYGRFNAALLGLFGMGRRRGWVEVDEREVRVHMGWGFKAAVPRSSIVAARRRGYVWWAYGVHWWGGAWIVNGSGHGMVTVKLDPPVRVRLTGWPRAKVKGLWISLEDPDGFLAAIGH